MKSDWPSRGSPTAATLTGQESALNCNHISLLLPPRHPGNPAAFTNFINVNEAFVEIIKDFESRAMQSGSEDPEVSLCLQKCEEYIPGEVDIRVRSVRVLITIM